MCIVISVFKKEKHKFFKIKLYIDFVPNSKIDYYEKALIPIMSHAKLTIKSSMIQLTV